MKNTPNYNLNKPDGNDYAKIEFLNANADIIDEELKRISKAIGNGSTGNDILSRLDTLETKVGNLNNLETTQKANLVAAINEVRQSAINSWQKGVYNDTTMTNLGRYSASRTFFVDYNDYKTKINVEIVQIAIPVTNFSGVIKVTMSSTWAENNSSGGAKVIHNIAKFNADFATNSKTITSISPQFAGNFFIGTAEATASHLLFNIITAPTKNHLAIKVDTFLNLCNSIQ